MRFKFLETGWVALLLACAAVVGYLNYLTPMHSDDYFYNHVGLITERHFRHYMIWSGRVVADYISPLLLSIPGDALRALVQTGGLFLLFFTLTRVATLSVVEQEEKAPAALVASVMLLLYVLFLPAFGQVNFWVVGSANYMWTALLYGAYIYFLLAYHYGKSLPWYAYPLALIAGCTNESAAATLALASFAFIGYCYMRGSRDRLLSLVLFCMLFLAGAVVLIGSPGNQVRLENAAFDWFTSMSLLEKVQRYVLETLPAVFLELYPVYVVSLVLLALSIVVRRDQKEQIALQIIFILLSLASIASMVLSPSFAPRAMTIPFVLNLLAIGVGVSCLAQGTRRRAVEASAGVLACAAVLYVLLSLVPGYRSLDHQFHFREALIARSGTGHVQIPAFYYPRLPSESYLIDKHVNLELMARYYGVESMEEFGPGFDYGLMHREGREEGLFIDEARDDAIMVKRANAEPGLIWQVQFETVDGTSEAHFAHSFMPLLDERYYYYVARDASGSVLPKTVRFSPVHLQGFAEGDFLGKSVDAGEGQLSVYLHNHKLIFFSENCSEQLVEDSFFVHVYPADEQSLVGQGKEGPFENLDFRFEDKNGYLEAGYCFVVQDLPRYPIAQMNIGQFNAAGRSWQISYQK